MLTRLDLIGEQLGDNTITGIAKLLVCNRGAIDSDMKRLQIDGIVITENNFPELDEAYAMMECEIIIVPKKLHTGAQGSLNSSYRVDQFLTCGYHDNSNWKKHEDLTVNSKKKRNKKS